MTKLQENRLGKGLYAEPPNHRQYIATFRDLSIELDDPRRDFQVKLEARSRQEAFALARGTESRVSWNFVLLEVADGDTALAQETNS